MRTKTRVFRPVLAVIVLFGSVALGLANAGPASAAFPTRRLAVEFRYRIQGAGDTCDQWTRKSSMTDSNGWAGVEFTIPCGNATLMVGASGQIRSDGKMDVFYGVTFRHNGSVSYRYKNVTLSHASSVYMTNTRLGANGVWADLYDPYASYY